MYQSYYNLNELPFQISPDPKYLWQGQNHKEALSMLKYALLTNKGFMLITGDAGTGKTTIVNALLNSINHNDIVVANIFDPDLDRLGLFNFIADSFKINQKVTNKYEFISCFSKFLYDSSANNKRVLLIVDEAHRLSNDLLEQLRLLSNIERPDNKLLNIFFIGQNELRRTLMARECQALAQRITVTYQIRTLRESETEEYVKYRLKVAGTEEEIFMQTAIPEICRLSRGYPRLINIICDHALLIGYIRNLKTISPDVIRDCSGDLNSLLQAREVSLSNSLQLSATGLFRPIKRRFVKVIDLLLQAIQRAETRVTSFKQSLGIKLGTIQKEKTEGAHRTDSKRPAAKLKQHRLLLGALAASVVVIATTLAFLYQKDLFLIADQQKPTASVLTSPTPLPSETGRHLKPLALPKNIATTAPGHPIEVESAGKLETPKIVALELAKDALKKKNFGRAVKLFEDAMARQPEDMPRVKMLYAQALRGQAGRLLATDPNEAEILLGKAVEADPQNWQAHFDLGKLYTKSQDYPKAIRAYQKAADLNSRSSDTLFNLGFVYAETKSYVNAEKMFLGVAELRPDYLDKALFNLAVVQQKQGKRQQCIENLEKTLMANPNNQKARKHLNQFKGDSGGLR